MKTVIFLDDERNHGDVFWVNYNLILKTDRVRWVTVRNYSEFIEAIQKNVVDMISFDHDLGIGKTGYDCLKRLIEVCEASRLEIPTCVFHTKNPVGKQNMEQLYNGYIEYTRR